MDQNQLTFAQVVLTEVPEVTKVAALSCFPLQNTRFTTAALTPTHDFQAHKLTLHVLIVSS